MITKVEVFILCERFILLMPAAYELTLKAKKTELKFYSLFWCDVNDNFSKNFTWASGFAYEKIIFVFKLTSAKIKKRNTFIQIALGFNFLKEHWSSFFWEVLL